VRHCRDNDPNTGDQLKRAVPGIGISFAWMGAKRRRRFALPRALHGAVGLRKPWDSSWSVG
jgi:hypothetical protein